MRLIPLGTGRLLCSSLLQQIHKNDFSACTPVYFIIFFLSLSVKPSLPSDLHTDCAGKPRHPTSTGKHHVHKILNKNVSIRLPPYIYINHLNMRSSTRSCFTNINVTCNFYKYNFRPMTITKRNSIPVLETASHLEAA